MQPFTHYLKTIIWSLLFLNISCSSGIQPSPELQRLTGATLDLSGLPVTYSEKCPKILFYIDPQGCTSCRLRATLQWYTQNRIQVTESNPCRVLLILAPTTPEQQKTARSFCDLYDQPETVLWDSLETFIHQNPIIPLDENYHTFLLDHNNRIILVGSPVGNPRMWSLYLSALEQLNLTPSTSRQ